MVLNRHRRAALSLFALVMLMPVAADAVAAETGALAPRQVSEGLEPAQAVAVRFYERRGGALHRIDGALAFGRPFIVEVAFDRVPADGEKTAQLEIAGQPRLEIPLLQNRENPRLYRSKPVTVAAPAKD